MPKETKPFLGWPDNPYPDQMLNENDKLLQWPNPLRKAWKKCSDACAKAVKERDAEKEEENKQLRLMLFEFHGKAGHMLYGDDGERQCNTCMIDFKRDPIEKIRKLTDAKNRIDTLKIMSELRDKS